MAHSGVKVDRFPVTHTTWERWLELHPDTTVVSLDAGFERQYFPPSEPGSAYYEYRASTEAMFPVFSVDDGLISDDGHWLARIPARELFWFAWFAFSPVPRFIPAGRHAAAFFRKQVYLYQLN